VPCDDDGGSGFDDDDDDFGTSPEPSHRAIRSNHLLDFSASFWALLAGENTSTAISSWICT